LPEQHHRIHPLNKLAPRMSYLPIDGITLRRHCMNVPSKNLSGHILPNAATMAGVCVTVISIIKGMQIGYPGLIIDKVLALDSIIFLASAVCSYFAMRLAAANRADQSLRLENLADSSFMFGLLLMVIGTVGFSFEIL
jgi:hypothetical protein